MQDDRVVYTAVQATNTTHSQNFLPMIQGALTVCGYRPKDVDLYAITTGPGSFTGLRIGMAVIKGMASATNTACIGVSSLKALAKSVDFNGVIIPAFDARRKQVYACVMDGEDVSVLEKYIKDTEKDVYFVGDGKNMCYNTYKEHGNVKQNSVEMPCIALGACLLAKAEYDANGGKTHFDLSPSYLRLSQAERELKEKMEAQQ